MSTHTYPRQAILADYLRAIAGLAIGYGPVATGALGTFMNTLLGAIGTLFLVYLLRTILRQLTLYEVDEAGIRARGPIRHLDVELRWEDLRALRLRYFSTHQDRTGGWMQLDLRGRGGKISVDSGLEDFTALVLRAAAGARAAGVEPNPDTLLNLRALESPPPPGRGASGGPAAR